MRRRENGSALVELAVALPVLLLVLFGVADLARVFYFSIALSNAARAGAQYGADSLANSVATSSISNAATGSIPLVSGVSVTSSRNCACATNAGVFDAPAANAAACAALSCGGSKHLVLEVSVTTTKSFQTVARYPGVPSPITLTRKATMRVPN